MPADDASPSAAIRLLVPGDISWALDLAERAYGRKLDREIWMANVQRLLDNPCVKIVRGEESCVVCEVYYPLPGDRVIEGKFHYWFHAGTHARDLFRCFAAAIDWMRRVGAAAIYLCPTTGVDASPLAAALGFRAVGPAFILEASNG